MKSIYKKLCIIGVAICVAAFLVWGVLHIWMFKAAEIHAECSDGLTIWRRNPGAWSGYVFEIRDGTKVIESGLRSRHLDDFMKEHGCHTLEGG